MTRDLTPRQRQIAKYVAAGLTTKEIARVTGLSRFTVDTHIRDAAEQIPGGAPPRNKLTVWFLTIDRAA